MLRVPFLQTDIPEVDRAFRIACGDFTGNIALYRAGQLKESAPVITAGMDYCTPWTRDAAFNTWFAGGLLAPEEAKNSLLSVLSSSGPLRIDEAFGQYWDIIIWTFGAWNYLRCTGDREFLEVALEATANTLAVYEAEEFDPGDGLFRGGACFQDGVAGYPDAWVSQKRDSGILGILDDEPRPAWFATRGRGISCKALSTNCLYLLAYEFMATRRIGESQWRCKTEDLRLAIDRNFRNRTTGSYRYLIDAMDSRERQEGLGLAFGVLSGAISSESFRRLLPLVRLTPHGIAAVDPQYERYAVRAGGYARHSGTVWPQVNAAWCSALAELGENAFAYRELELLAHKVCRDGMFYEIYHPETGLPYGGLQEQNAPGFAEWNSCRRQTWCATGFLHMVFRVLFGMKIGDDEISFAPYLPDGCEHMTLRNLHWRGRTLDLEVTRRGDGQATLLLNGEKTSIVKE